MKLYDIDAKEPYMLDGKHKVKPIIKCGDCRMYDFCKGYLRINRKSDFCSNGKPKEENECD